MTSTPVKGINTLMNYVQTKQANAADSFADNFTDVFSKTSGQADLIQQNDKLQSGAKVKVSYTDKKGLDNAEPAVKEVKKPKLQKLEEEAAVKEAGEGLVQDVAEELGVSVEEVQAAMEELGLSAVDLLNGEKLTELVLAITGEDMLSLMTDENLYHSLQNLLAKSELAVNNLKQEFVFSDEEIAAIVEQIQSAEDTDAVEAKPAFAVDDEVEIPEGQEDYTVTVEHDGETVKVSVKVDGNSEESAEVTTGKVQMPEDSEKADTKEHNSKQNSAHDSTAQTNMLLENLLNKDNTVKSETVFANEMTGRTADTQNIMNQIMDYMKVQVKSDLTQMEIQLHPANLGTVNVNITSREGVITAQFLTQNETVKAAIESQIVQLRNNFEEQGLKVEAVEVTVESHQFERNLSDQGRSQEQAQENGKKGVKKLNLNLNELSLEEEPDLDEDEKLAVEMMAAGGNTVSYTA